MINFNTTDTIIFDFGGTLDINGTHWSMKFWEVYQKNKVPINYGEFREAYVYSEPNVSKYVKKDDNLFSTLKTQVSLQLNYLTKRKISFSNGVENYVNQITKDCYKDVISNINDTRQLLNSLKLDYKIGLVSNFYGNIKTVCKELDIDSYFDVIIDSTEINISKPEPKIFELAIKMLKSSPDKTIVIGDSYQRDVIPAKKLGCKTIWLKGKSWKEEHNTGDADFIIHSLFEIENICSRK